MSESDTMFNDREWRCAAVQLILSTDPSYDNRTIASTLKMQIWIATNNRDVPRVMKTKFPAMVMVFGVVSSEDHIMSPHTFKVGLKVNTKVYLDVLKSVVIPWCNQVASGRPWVWQQDLTPAHMSRLGFRRNPPTLYPSLTSLKSAWKSTLKCTWMCWRVWWSLVAIRWPVADPGCGCRTRCWPTDPGLASEGVLRLCTLLSLASPDLNPLDYFVWSYVKNITNMTSHKTKASLIAVICWACGKGMLPVPDPYRGDDWGWKRLHWRDVSPTT